MPMIYFYRSFAGYRPTNISRLCEGRRSARAQSSWTRGEALSLELCVSVKVQIFFSTQILPNLQQSSLLQQLQLTTEKKKRLQGILSCFVWP